VFVCPSGNGESYYFKLDGLVRHAKVTKVFRNLKLNISNVREVRDLIPNGRIDDDDENINTIEDNDD
jgi:hypothetical protein